MHRALPWRCCIVLAGLGAAVATVPGCHFVSRADQQRFDIQSVDSGPWSDVTTWQPQRRPRAGDRVLIQPGHEVVYDLTDRDVIRSIAVAGTLTFARDRGTVAVSERDGERFRREFGIAGVRVIPTGVDLDFYGFAPRTGRGDVTRTGGTLVFSGAMMRRPNIDGLEWLMEEAWAEIVAASPNTGLVVVGRDPPRRLVAEAEHAGWRGRSPASSTMCVRSFAPPTSA